MTSKLTNEEKLKLELSLCKDFALVMFNFVLITTFKDYSKEDKINFLDTIIRTWNEKINNELDTLCKKKAPELSEITNDPVDVTAILIKVLSTEQILIKEEFISSFKNMLNMLINKS